MAFWECPSCERTPREPILLSLDEASQEAALRSAATEYDDEQKTNGAFAALLQELHAQHDREVISLQQRLNEQQTVNKDLLKQIGEVSCSSKIFPPSAEPDLPTTPRNKVQALEGEDASSPQEEEPASEPELGETLVKTSRRSQGLNLSRFEAMDLQNMHLKEFENEHHAKTAKSAGICQRLRDVVEGDTFETAIGVLILINVFVMGMELQFHGMQAGYTLGMPGLELPAANIWPWAETVVPIIQTLFTVFFALELVLRVSLLRIRFFTRVLNWVDVFVVAASTIELFYTVFGTLVNPLTLRLLRIAKAGRALRVARTTRVLESLHLLTRCISASLMTLFWSLCLLLVIQFIAGMILMSLVNPAIVNSAGLSHAQQVELYKYYGTFTRTMLTMFEVLFANWIPSCRVLIEYVSEWFSFVFIMYRCIVGFAVLNVVNAVFIQQTMKVAQADNDLMILQKQKAAQSFAKKLRHLFEQLDESGDGLLSYDEFCALVKDDKMMALLASLEIEADDLQELYKLLDNGDGELACDEFVEGAARVKGAARGIDVVVTLTTVKRLERQVHDLLQTMGRGSTRVSRISHNLLSASAGAD